MSNYATWADRILETTSSTGTGSYTLAGAVGGYQSFSIIGNGNTVYYSVCEATVSTGQWETGLGTWSTGGTLARTRIIDSSSSGAAINWGAGTKKIGITCCLEKAKLPDVQVFTTTGTSTWLKPNGATFVFVQVIGGGGGGGAGINSNNPRTGGGGGAGGNYSSYIFQASNLTSAVTVTIAKNTRVTPVGSSGESGGNTSFGSYLVAGGGMGGTSGAGSSSGGIPSIIGIRGGIGGRGVLGNPIFVAGVSAAGGGGGGAGGGNQTGQTTGGLGGNCLSSGMIGGIGGILGGAGTTGTNLGTSAGLGGGGGGGGGGVTGNTTGGPGGAGGRYGGGGGGGGSTGNTGTGGTGGPGAQGICVVTSW